MSDENDPLLSLPNAPAYLLTCSKCGFEIDGHTWISRDWGCGKCAPDDVQKALDAMSTEGGRPS